MNQDKTNIYVYTSTIDRSIVFTVVDISTDESLSKVLVIQPGVPGCKLLFRNGFEKFAKKAIEQGGFYLNNTLKVIDQIDSSQSDTFEYDGKYYNVG